MSDRNTISCFNLNKFFIYDSGVHSGGRTAIDEVVHEEYYSGVLPSENILVYCDNETVFRLRGDI